VARNKIDLVVTQNAVSVSEAAAGVSEGTAGSSDPILHVSARTGEGVHALRERLVRLASVDVRNEGQDVLITNRRHLDALQRAASRLDAAQGSLANGATNDLVALDLREAVNTLAEITGEMTSEEILNAIFSRFCIGK
jgi:tRNA modification GTPase